MNTYNIFRNENFGLGPSWVKGEDNLETAKREAIRFAVETNRRYFVLDLSSSKVLYRTEAAQQSKPRAT